jgi:serine/threonine protein kinase
MLKRLSFLARAKYKIDYTHVIEEGSFGNICLAQNIRSKQVVVAKIIRKDAISQSLYDQVLNEGTILKSIQHPNIIKLHHVKDTANRLILFMDYYERKDLHYFLGDYSHISEKVTYRIINQVTSAVEYLHQHHIIHRDIKLENMLYDSNNNIVLIDFGFATVRKHDAPLLRHKLGSKLYIAPEIVLDLPYTGYDSDMWAIGVCLYLLVMGNYPFDTDTEILEKTPLIYNVISSECEELIRELLNKNPDLRPSATKMKSSPWFTLWK